MNIDNNFDSSTLDDKLQEINNGYLSDIKLVNEQKDKIENLLSVIYE